MVGPEKRPYHTIIPGMMTPAPGGAETDLMAFGVMGGFMQPQGHLQVVSRLRDFGQNPQAALDAPRWQWKRGLAVALEPGFDRASREYLERLGHELTLADNLRQGGEGPEAAPGAGKGGCLIDPPKLIVIWCFG